MKKPNFFIVGAPRCGTTALSQYISEHPNVFISPIKEPHYFAEDFWQHREQFTTSLDEYLALFEKCTSEHLAVGEASVWYLYSSVAVENICRFNENSKIIVMLRNPIDMVYSIYSKLLYTRHEDRDSFEKAWRLQDARERGISLPKKSRTSDRSAKLLQYRKVGKLGQQVDGLLQVFPRKQVEFILFEDFIHSPQAVYADVLQFLSVPVDEREHFPRVNAHRENRIGWIAGLMKAPIVTSLSKRVKSLLNVDYWVISKWINDLNTIKRRRPALDPAFRHELMEEFREDIQRLSKILDRDLSSWLEEHRSLCDAKQEEWDYA